ncbi:hypothetical protein [Hyalangium sp.]|uniref:hypothetical protein n=1 Tax=Hyalangium sp. TaxID=2028555 RepID=UPI002D2AA713|nr:hypothetical protein [Hyalangium sp.]HYI00531.1 hypothetical protein [Hyalangium sp.]
MSQSSQSRILSWLSALVLTLLVSLPGCDCGSTGADTRRYPCTQDTECTLGFVCLEGVCQPEGGPVDPPDGGTDAGTPDGGPTDGGPTDGGPTDGGSDGGPDGGSDGGSDGGTADGGGTDGGADAGTPDGGSPPQPTQLNFITPAQTMVAGQCSGAVVVETQDSMGRAAPVDANTNLVLSAQPNTGFGFYRDAACSTSAFVLTLPAGSSRATFYFRGTVAQSVRITVLISGMLPPLQNETITPAAPAIVSFITSSQTLPAGGCSSLVELEARDAYGNPSPFSSQTRVALFAQASAGFSFFTDAACTASTSEAVFSAGSARTRFYFKGKTRGTFPLTATVSGLSPASQDETILPAVRTDLCTLPLGARSVTCPISPPQLDLSKTLLMFQASSDDDSPDTASLRCSLTALDTLTCSRNDGDEGDDEPEIDIVWQTAELPSGLKVQHLQTTCGGAALRQVTIQPVASPQSTFLLVSSEQDGSTQGDDDFYTASLAATNRVDLQFSTPCTPSWRASLQVVELTGATVTRGVTGPMSGTSLTVSVPSGVNLSSSALLFTYRASETDDSIICDRVLRGVLSPNAITFTRGANATGCTDADIDAISWELIDFGARASAQHVHVTMDSSTSEVDMPITAVDPSRTLVFASGQSQSGQAGGETDYEEDDVIGASLGWHGLRTPTILTVARGAEEGTARWQSTVLQLEP